MSTIALKISQLGFIQAIINWGLELWNTIMASFWIAVYSIFFSSTALLVDAIFILFKKMVGLSGYYYGGNTEQIQGDIVISLINDPVVTAVFWRIFIVGLILLLLSTFVAVIKTEFSDFEKTDKMKVDWQNNKMRVFGKSVKTLINMIVVPAAAIVGLIFGNALLRTLDQATSSGNTSISGRIFITCAANSNRIRETDGKGDYYFEFVKASYEEEGGMYIPGSGNDEGDLDYEQMASLVDDAFLNGYKATVGFALHKSDEHTQYLGWLSSYGDEENKLVFNIYDAPMVFYYYNLKSFNFLVGFAVNLILVGIMGMSLIGVIKRLYEITIYFIISPVIVAITPLDDGAALGNWRKAFISSTLMAYSTVVTMNLYIILLGPLTKIKLFGVDDGLTGDFGEAGAGIFNYLSQIFIIIAGAVFVKEVSKKIAEMIGSSDAIGAGEEAKTNMQEKAKGIAGKISSGAKLVGGGAKLLGKGAKFVGDNAIKEGKALGGKINTAAANAKKNFDNSNFGKKVSADKTAKNDYKEEKRVLQDKLKNKQIGKNEFKNELQKSKENLANRLVGNKETLIKAKGKEMEVRASNLTTSALAGTSFRTSRKAQNEYKKVNDYYEKAGKKGLLTKDESKKLGSEFKEEQLSKGFGSMYSTIQANRDNEQKEKDDKKAEREAEKAEKKAEQQRVKALKNNDKKIGVVTQESAQSLVKKTYSNRKKDYNKK